MSLASILDQIKKVKPFAEEDTNTGPAHTLGARRGRKNQAIGQLADLKFQYRTELRETALFILVTGSLRNEFTETATKEFLSFSADPEGFYKDLAKRIPPVLYQGKESIGGIFDILGRHLEDKTREIGIREYNQLIFKQGYRSAVNTTEELTELVKTAVNQQMGGEVVGINAIHELTDAAIERGNIKKNTPVILNTGDEKLALTLVDALKRISHNVHLVVAGKGTKSLSAVPGVVKVKEVTNDVVESTLTNIQNSARK